MFILISHLIPNNLIHKWSCFIKSYNELGSFDCQISTSKTHLKIDLKLGLSIQFFDPGRRDTLTTAMTGAVARCWTSGTWRWFPPWGVVFLARSYGRWRVQEGVGREAHTASFRSPAFSTVPWGLQDGAAHGVCYWLLPRWESAFSQEEATGENVLWKKHKVPLLMQKTYNSF